MILRCGENPKSRDDWRFPVFVVDSPSTWIIAGEPRHPNDLSPTVNKDDGLRGGGEMKGGARGPDQTPNEGRSF